MALIGRLERNTPGAFGSRRLTAVPKAAKGERHHGTKRGPEHNSDDYCEYCFHDSLSKGVAPSASAEWTPDMSPLAKFV